MNSWKECVEEAKQELGIHGWTNDWIAVTDLAKEKYWNGEDFKQLKQDTIEFADGECMLCASTKRLVTHHIFYGEQEETMCLCQRCHGILRLPEIKMYGFVLQEVLHSLVKEKEEEFSETHWKYFPPNLFDICMTCWNKLITKVNEKTK